MIHTNEMNHLNSGIPRYRIVPDPSLTIASLAHSCARQFHPAGVHRPSLHFRQRQQPLDAQARDQPSAASNQFTIKVCPHAPLLRIALRHELQGRLSCKSSESAGQSQKRGRVPTPQLYIEARTPNHFSCLQTSTRIQRFQRFPPLTTSQARSPTLYVVKGYNPCVKARASRPLPSLSDQYTLYTSRDIYNPSFGMNFGFKNDTSHWPVGQEHINR